MWVATWADGNGYRDDPLAPHIPWGASVTPDAWSHAAEGLLAPSVDHAWLEAAYAQQVALGAAADGEMIATDDAGVPWGLAIRPLP